MKKSLIALAFLAASGAAMASGSGVYGFGTLGTQELDISVPGLNSSATQFQVGVGVPVSKRAAIEASWMRGGHGTSAGIDLAVQGFVVGIRGNYPLTPAVSLTGKVGMAAMSADMAGVGSADGIGATFGAGAEYKLNERAALTLNYDFYSKPADLLVDMGVLSVGLKFKF